MRPFIAPLKRLRLSQSRPTTVARPLLAVLGLWSLCFLVYFPLRRAGFIWDDAMWITKNPFVHHWGRLWDLWFTTGAEPQFYPLTATGFLLEWKLWGGNALAFHAVNGLLQGGNAVALWYVLRKLRIKSAWVAAAIWAIHPMSVETVAWAVEQKNLLSGFLSLMVVLCWIKFAALDRENCELDAGEGHFRWPFLALGAVVFLLALLAKTFVCALPAALLVLTWWKFGRLRTKHLLASVPLFVLTIFAAVMAVLQERSGGGAAGSRFRFSIWQHIAIAGKDFWFYPSKLLWPHPMLTIYPRWDVASFSIINGLLPTSAILLFILLWVLRGRIGRGPIAAVAIYCILISPALGFISFYTMLFSFVSDYFAYLACISLIVLFVEGVRTGWEKLDELRNAGAAKRGKTYTHGAFGCAIVVLLTLGVLSHRQCEVYTPPWNIWTHTLQYNRACFEAYDMLAVHAYSEHQYARSLALARKAHSIAGSLDCVSSQLVAENEVHFRQYANAIPWLRRTLKIDPMQPWSIAALAKCYEKAGNDSMALNDLYRGLHMMPKSGLLYVALGVARADGGDLPGAALAFRAAVECEPDSPKAWLDLGITQEKLGRNPAALLSYQNALALDPAFSRARFFYAQCLLRNRKPKEAIKELRRIIAAGPAPQPVYSLLAKALLLTGHPRKSADVEQSLKRGGTTRQ